MRDVNGWLMTLAFLLGLLLTLAMMIRRVTREVPVTHSVSAGIGKPDLDTALEKASGAVGAAGTAAAGAVAAAGAAATGAAAKLRDTAGKVAETVEEKIELVERKATAHAEKIEDVLEEEPYGAGSIRVSSRSAAPAGYTIKGNADSMLFHGPDSPAYEQTIAEVWFADEASAEKAGFRRWDANAGATAAGLVAGAAAVIREETGDAATVVTTGAVEEDPDAPYGRGSARAGADGSGPEGWLIKGNADSMLFHGPDSPAYEQTIAEVWFADEATAWAAGFDKWDKNFKK